jgi:hypothetical protein
MPDQSRRAFLRSVLGVGAAAMLGPAAVARALSYEDAPAAAPSFGAPVGTIVQVIGQRPPAGWLFCYGQMVPKAEFPDLFAAVGDTYGRATRGTFGRFTLPDCRGRVVLPVETIGEHDGIAVADRRLHARHLNSVVDDCPPSFILSDFVVKARAA